MARPKLITRSQAAERLHDQDKTKSVAQWHTFLNDNVKPHVKPENKIPFEQTVNNVSMYKTTDIDSFISKRKDKAKAKRVAEQSDRTQHFIEAYGLNDRSNDNSVGQSFGYPWKGGQVTLIADNADRGQPNAVSIQLQINHPLRVSALTTAQAAAFANEILEAVAQAKRLEL